MNLIHLTIGIVLALVLGGFLIYSSLAIRHASRFRYLSTRMVYITLFFIIISGVLIAAIIINYLGIVLGR